MSDASDNSRASTRVQYPRWLWAVGFVLAVIVAVAVVALFSVGTESTTVDQGAVERLLPANNSQVLQQESVGIDLAPGYDAALTVNGMPIPTDQLDKTTGLNIVMFQPGPGKVIEYLPSGQSCVLATYWRLDTGPGESSARTWCFTAS